MFDLLKVLKYRNYDELLQKYYKNIERGAVLVEARKLDDNGLFLGNNPMDLEPAIKSLSKILDHEFGEKSISNSGSL